jgi:hypothetical protein
VQEVKEFFGTTAGVLLAAMAVTMFSLYLVSRHTTDAKPIAFAELRDHIGEIVARAQLTWKGVLRLLLDVVATWWALKARNPLGVTDFLVSSATFSLAIPTVLDFLILVIELFR